MSQEETFVKNPETGRPVKVGGRIWTRLVKKGMITDNGYTDPNILSENIPDNPKLKITEINQKLPVEIQAVKGRGKYEGKIVKREKPIRKKPVVIQQQQSDTSESESDDDLKGLILSELSQSSIFPKKKTKPIPIPKKNRTKSVYTTDTDYTEITTCADDDETQSE